MRHPTAILALLCAAASALAADPAPRARDLGIPFYGTPGPLNAITDVAGVEVGYTTLISGSADRPLEGPVIRTGVTAVLPRGRAGAAQSVYGGWFTLNGNGEMTGTTWLEESGTLAGPVMITNTHSVGVVHDATIAWLVEHSEVEDSWSLPVVAETWDGWLNELNGFHVKPEHARAALDGARGGPIAEGNVGGGTGMHSFEFKGGTGTSSRRVRVKGVADYTVGVLVQSNFGRRWQLQIAGVPVGRAMPENAPFTEEAGTNNELGSIIAVVATDAPLLPHQLERVARRVSIGLARVGSMSGNGSGDIFVAFSTANAEAASSGGGIARVEALANDSLDGLFEATALATEEAIVNAMVAARTLDGIEGHVLHAIDHEQLRAQLRKYGRLDATP